MGDASVRGNERGRGLISFISNNAWLDGLSHVSMRARYLNEFQSIYIDNLNGDKYRTGKTTPDGRPDPSAFSTPQNREGIQVGTAIATLIRTSPARADGEIALRDLWGTHKLSHLDREARREVEPEYGNLQPNPALGLPFAARTVSRAYAEWPRLPELFPQSYPGIKTSRDFLLIDIDRAVLEERMLKYHDPSITAAAFEELVPGALTDGYMYPALQVRSELVRRKYRPWQIRKYTYRPFDQRWIYWEPSTDLLRRKVEDFTAQLTSHNTWLEARQRESGEVFSRGSIAGGLADNVGNGYSSFTPLRVLSGPSLLAPHGRLQENLSGEAADFLNELEADYKQPSDLFFHGLAIIHTPRYREENAGALLNDWPRIPLPARRELLTHSASLGRRLAELLDPESELQLAGAWSFLARLSLPPELPEGTPDRDQKNAGRLAVTAGWGGRGQGETVMPRRGDARAREWTATERERIAGLAVAEGLTAEQTLELLGERCVDVYLNGDAYWAAVPLRVWEYTLGGYQVLKKWLSYREEPLLGRPLREDEARYVQQVVRRIAAILLMGPALDASYGAILPEAGGLGASGIDMAN